MTSLFCPLPIGERCHGAPGGTCKERGILPSDGIASAVRIRRGTAVPSRASVTRSVSRRALRDKSEQKRSGQKEKRSRMTSLFLPAADRRALSWCTRRGYQKLPNYTDILRIDTILTQFSTLINRRCFLCIGELTTLLLLFAMKCDIVYSENEGVYNMKKLTTLIITLLIACLPLTFFSCSFDDESEQIEYDRIELTTENYDEYLYISSTISDCLYDVVEVNESTGTHYYNLSCIINVEISPARKEYRFDGDHSSQNGSFVAIFFSFYSSDWSDFAGSCLIDYYGYAKHSISTSKEDSVNLRFPILGNGTAFKPLRSPSVDEIRGYVLIPKNFEA